VLQRGSNLKKRLFLTILGLLLLTNSGFAKPGPVDPAQVSVWNQQLTNLDQQYKSGTINYDSMIAAKKAVLVAAGFSYNRTTSAFNDFASFVDAKIQLLYSAKPMKLFRRGGNNEAAQQYGLGHWYGGNYESLYGQRMNMAVLEKWNSPLTGMYWADLPADQLIITGAGAEFVEPDGTVRPGGPDQYWLLNDSKEISGWLTYALYSPAYLESYAAALNAAQLLSNDIGAALSEHLDTIRRSGTASDGVWAAVYGSDSNYTDSAVNNEMIVSNVTQIGGQYYIEKSTFSGNFAYNNRDYGVTVGWDTRLAGKADEQNAVLGGVFFNYGNMVQNDSSSTIKNVVDEWRGGVFLTWQMPLRAGLSPYATATLAFGRDCFANTVNSWPGASAQNFTVDYAGNHFAAGVQSGVDFDFGSGWLLQPQLFAGMDAYYTGAFSDAIGAAVNSAAWNTGQIGVGLKFQKDFYRAADKFVSIWLDTSAASRLGSNATISVNDEVASAALGQYTYTGGIGGKLLLPDLFSLQINYQNTSGAYYANSFAVQFGKNF